MEINGQKSSILKIVKMQKSDMKNLSSHAEFDGYQVGVEKLHCRDMLCNFWHTKRWTHNDKFFCKFAIQLTFVLNHCAVKI